MHLEFSFVCPNCAVKQRKVIPITPAKRLEILRGSGSLLTECHCCGAVFVLFFPKGNSHRPSAAGFDAVGEIFSEPAEVKKEIPSRQAVPEPAVADWR